MTWVDFHKEKNQTLDSFKVFKARVGNEVNLKIKYLRLDRGGEFTSSEFNAFSKMHGIKNRVFYSKNGSAEWSS